jgi:signal peptidase complex subunit 3
LFHWNTKQLFIYITAEYNNPDGVSIYFPIVGALGFQHLWDLQTRNEAVMWDRIVRRKEDALIDVVVGPNTRSAMFGIHSSASFLSLSTTS